MLDTAPDEPNELLEIAKAALELVEEMDAHTDPGEYDGSRADRETAAAALDRLTESIARLKERVLRC